MPGVMPILLAGGSGNRLWPLSRANYPKQFLPILGEVTLFQESAKRLISSDTVKFAAPITITNSDFRFVVTQQLQNVGIDPGAILIEPESRNTAPAILAAVLYAAINEPDGTVLIAPSDHIISDTESFHDRIMEGLRETEKGRIVTFGVTPERPETGYGYLELPAAPSVHALPVSRFVEKPDKETAEAMLSGGKHLWNSGIFLSRATDLVKAFRTHMPELFNHVSDAIEKGQKDLGFLWLAAEPWARCEDIAIDYAIMEKIDTLSAIPFHAGWNDLGGWDSIWLEQGPDAAGVVATKNSTAIECQNVLLRSEDNSQHLVGLGLKNIIAISVRDAVLVASKDRAQDVKMAVSALKGKGVKQADTSIKDHRPWGWFESLISESRFQVKQIHVQAKAALSLQSHRHRSEHWIVVEGTAKVTVNDVVTLLTEGQSAFVPLGAVHRLENPNTEPLLLIEVQTGDYLGEDDIVRYEDMYSRSTSD